MNFKEKYRRRKSAEDSGRKKRKIKEEINFNETIYGIGIFDMIDKVSLEDEGDWISELKFCEIYYPVYSSLHRNTAFLLYKDESTRNQIFSCKKLRENNGTVVTKICFEINPGEQPSDLIETFFHDIKNLLTSQIITPNQKLAIKHESMITLSKCYIKYKETSSKLLATIDPDPDTLHWFLICEILLFFIYNIRDIDSCYLCEFINSFAALGWNSFNTKLKALDQTTRVFVIDALWQEICYKKETTRGIWLNKAFSILNFNLAVGKLDISEPNFLLFHELLSHQRLHEALSPFLDNEDYSSLITKILGNAFMINLPKGHHGITLPNRSIVIDSTRPFSNSLHVSAYRLVILIHEIGHLLVRSKCTSFQQFLEYNILESSFEESPKKTSSIPESGFQIEKKFFGMQINKLTSTAAEFLMNKTNWSAKNFQKIFKNLNSQTQDPNSAVFETVRIRKNLDDDDEDDFSSNWCLTSYFRMNSN